MKTETAKLISSAVILTINLVFGLIPGVIISSVRKKQHASGTNTLSSARTKHIMSWLNCFAGGVFFSTTFLHLLPEVTEAIEDAMKASHFEPDIALPQLIICVGFFVIMFVEHIAVTVLERKPSEVSVDLTSNKITTYVHNVDKPDVKERQSLLASNHQTKEPLSSSVREDSRVLYGSIEVSQQSPNYSGMHEHNNSADDHENVCVHIHTSTDSDSSGQRRLRLLRSFMLVFALSIHTLFEGLAVGLENTVSDVFRMLLSIGLHKSVIAFSLGIQLSEIEDNAKTSSRQNMISMIFFAVMCPVGIIIGMLTTLQETGNSNIWATPLLEAMATGTFIYVTFMEVLQKELAESHSVFKVLCVALGFILFAVFNAVFHE